MSKLILSPYKKKNDGVITLKVAKPKFLFGQLISSLDSFTLPVSFTKLKFCSVIYGLPFCMLFLEGVGVVWEEGGAMVE